jgi:hypothetical protein
VLRPAIMTSAMSPAMTAATGLASRPVWTGRAAREHAAGRSIPCERVRLGPHLILEFGSIANSADYEHMPRWLQVDDHFAQGSLQRFSPVRHLVLVQVQSTLVPGDP